MSSVTDDDLGPYTLLLGLEIDSADGDEVTAHWVVRHDLLQPHGLVHGGVYCSVVETVASLGASLWLGDRGEVVGVSNSTDFFRSTMEGVLRATGRPVHRGRSQQVWVVEIVDDRQRLVSRGQVRLQNLT